MIGQQIGMYRLVRQQGAGALGEVYAAEHVKTGRIAAIKVLSPELTGIAGALDRLFTELRATSLVRHPGMVEIHDCDRLPDGRGYVVREYLEGETLRDCLSRSGDFSGDLDAVRIIMIQTADVLAAAHEKGILHLDLKPDNIFLASAAEQDPPIQVKLLDFGMANIAQRGTRRTAVAAGLTTATAQYLSPEQCRGGSDPDHRADIYALGCILFEMLTGRPPFIRPSAAELLAAHAFDPPPHVQELNPSVPASFDQLLVSMLAKDPSQRPSTLGEITAAVAAAASERTAAASMTLMLDASSAASMPVAPRRTVFLQQAALAAPGAPAQVSEQPVPSAETNASCQASAPVAVSVVPQNPAPPSGAAPAPMSGLAGATRILLPGEAEIAAPRRPLPSTPVTPIAARETSQANKVPAQTASATSAVERKMSTTLSSTVGELTREPQRFPWKVVAVAGAAVVAIGIATALALKQPTSEPAAAASPIEAAPVAAPVAAPPRPAVPAAPETVSVRLDSTPAGAKVFVVGEDTPIGETPLEMRRPMSGTLRVRLEKAGYQPLEQSIDLSSDAVVTSQLQKRRAATTPTRPGKAKSANLDDVKLLEPSFAGPKRRP